MTSPDFTVGGPAQATRIASAASTAPTRRLLAPNIYYVSGVLVASGLVGQLERCRLPHFDDKLLWQVGSSSFG